LLFTAWMAILARTGDVRRGRGCLVLRHPARGRGAAWHRPRPPDLRQGRADAYLARLACADLFEVDTFPYNAGTVASDAIRAGLPLVTLQGEAFAFRHGGATAGDRRCRHRDHAGATSPGRRVRRGSHRRG
jgi:hypothetical protein